MRDNRPSPAVYELLEEVGRAADTRELLCTLGERLGAVLAFDALRVYRPSDSAPVGEIRRAGETRRPVFSRGARTGSPASPGFRSMLAAPLEDGEGVAGVLAIYSFEAAAFSPEDLGAVLWIRADLARALRKAMRAEATALV